MNLAVPAAGQSASAVRIPQASAARRAASRAFAQAVARLAVGSLHAELVLYPKPGLVSPVDNGSHDDMCTATFMRSLFTLRHYFRHICQAGQNDAPFATLKQLGIDAERRMLRATGGINTHRGAIFCLGMLCAAAGRAHALGVEAAPAALRTILTDRWGPALSDHTLSTAGCAASHGQQVAARHAASGAREEGALGFPSVFEIGLPALQASRHAGRSQQQARIDALFALMAQVNDTNVYHRGGPAGARMVRRHARHYLARGGSDHPQWYATAVACHRAFVRRRLSPGGCADLLAAACLAHALGQLELAS